MAQGHGWRGPEPDGVLGGVGPQGVLVEVADPRRPVRTGMGRTASHLTRTERVAHSLAVGGKNTTTAVDAQSREIEFTREIFIGAGLEARSIPVDSERCGCVNTYNLIENGLESIFLYFYRTCSENFGIKPNALYDISKRDTHPSPRLSASTLIALATSPIAFCPPPVCGRVWALGTGGFPIKIPPLRIHETPVV